MAMIARLVVAAALSEGLSLWTAAHGRLKPALRLLAAATLAGAALLAAAADTGRVPKPAIVIEKGDKCVADTDTMRRDHMKLLKHQRDKTVREGIRSKQFSLNECIGCHASRKTGSVIGSKDNFCQGCHAYAAVKLDCFECHQAKARPALQSQAAPSNSELLASMLRGRGGQPDADPGAAKP